MASPTKAAPACRRRGGAISRVLRIARGDTRTFPAWKGRRSNTRIPILPLAQAEQHDPHRGAPLPGLWRKVCHCARHSKPSSSSASRSAMPRSTTSTPAAACSSCAAMCRQVDFWRRSSGKCSARTRTSASVVSVVTVGMMIVCGKARDQFGHRCMMLLSRHQGVECRIKGRD